MPVDQSSQRARVRACSSDRPTPAGGSGPQVVVIIPALNEEEAIDRVVRDVLPSVDRVVVVDNGSRDRTAERAARAGATVVQEPLKGYGYACLRGMAEARDAFITVFMDGDYGDCAEDMNALLDPIRAGAADMVLGSRVRGRREKGAMLPHALLANYVFAAILRITCRLEVTDIGPFRAIRTGCLDGLHMQEGTFGWTLEMMIKAARQGLAVREVPVGYRRRIGRSKVSGSPVASLQAGLKMGRTLWRYLR